MAVRVEFKHIVLLILVVLGVGAIGPRFVLAIIGNGMKRAGEVEGQSFQCVEEAYTVATTMVSGGLEAFFNTGLRITRVERLPDPSCSCPYQVTIQAYTFFGIPYDTFVVTCDGVYRTTALR
ncbi:MAG TPA: hypothetical protein EYP49_02860 [Anaerolineae bacterium]|nr:hypothetical protein [Anaerolineae bacterium]